MILISPAQIAALGNWLTPERPSLVALHILNTGNGACFVDRWPEPRTVLLTIGTLCSLIGNPGAFPADNLRRYVAGLMFAPEEFVPLLKEVFPDIREVERIVLELQEVPRFVAPPDFTVRRLASADAHHLWGLTSDLRWIANTWGGPAGLAASGYAWGAFIQSKLVSVACTFLVGSESEDLGVVTESGYRGRGLAAVCGAALCQDAQARGHRATWTTSSDNQASLRVAEKLGFKVQGREILYILGQPAPVPQAE